MIEVPGPIPQTLLLQVLNPVAADVDYGKIFTKLNGEGAGYHSLRSARHQAGSSANRASGSCVL